MTGLDKVCRDDLTSISKTVEVSRNSFLRLGNKLYPRPGNSGPNNGLKCFGAVLMVIRGGEGGRELAKG